VADTHRLLTKTAPNGNEVILNFDPIPARKRGTNNKYSQAMLIKAKKYVAHGYEAHLIPTVQGLATYIGVTRDSIYKWRERKEFPGFNLVLEELQNKQHDLLIINGLLGTYNTKITALMLAKHGYHEKHDIALETVTYKPVIKRYDGSVDSEVIEHVDGI
jgi:hypothetical protein